MTIPEVLLSGVVAILALLCWKNARAGLKRERLHRDISAAFAARNDTATVELAARVGADEERLWRRLITTRAASEELANEEARTRRDFEDVLASLQDAVLVVDSQSRLRFLNAAALRTFEIRIEDVLGAHLIEALPSFALENAMRAALREGISVESEIQLYAPRLREVLLRVAPLKTGAGTEVGAVAIVQDLTELRRLERVRRDFVANASHELRTPIATIRALAETLQSNEGDAAAATRFLPPLISEAERISHLVTDLLDLARAEANETPTFAPVALEQPISSAIARLKSKAARRQIEISWHAPSSSPQIQGDAAGLEQIIFNLLDNALSYTPHQGQVTLNLRASPANAVAIIEVSDSGIGIPSEDLDRVFERFYRVDKARSRAEGGTGLGLAIVKHIVENHGGHISVQSEVGRGTTFQVEFPLP